MKVYIHIFAVLVVALLSFELASAYEPAIQWQKTFGGSNSDSGYSVQQISDGGYIIAGVTYSFGAVWSDVYLIKTDSTGNLVWQKTFGGSDFDWGYSVQQATDGGFIIAGTTCSFGDPLGDVYLIKADPNGNTLWQNTFGGSGAEYGYSVQQTSDGGYIIAGRTRFFGAGWEDVYLIKTNSAGNLLWQKTFGGSSGDVGSSVQQTSDGGFIIAGMSHPGTRSADVYLVKTDPNGNQEWQKTFGRVYADEGFSVQQTIDGGFIIAGDTRSFGAGNWDVYLIKTDSGGNLAWQKTVGGNSNDSGRSIQKTSDGGYIVAGSTVSFGAGKNDVYLIKLSSEVCQYVLFGDVNSDCKFDFYDFALMSANWLIDCNINPSDPACLSK